MKSIVSNIVSKKELPFPKLMISDESRIVLFTTPRAGTILHDATGLHAAGYVSTEWSQQYFSDFTGEIVISNQ